MFSYIGPASMHRDILVGGSHEKKSVAGQGLGDAEAPRDGGASDRRSLRLFIIGALVIIGSLGAFVGAVLAPKADVTTDDAYVRAHYATIAPRVAGQISGVSADNTQWVRAGDLLATIDDRDFKLAVEGARAQLEHDHSQVQTLEASIATQKMMIAQAEADVRSTAAQLSFATIDARRYDHLAATGAGTIKNQQQADTTLRTSSANAQSAQARLGAARRQLDMIDAQLKSACADIKLDKARLDQASLNLTYTWIRAPMDGMVGARSVQVGDYVGAGTSLMTVAPLEALYIDANYREVQLAHVARGQRVSIHIDAYDIDLVGEVVGIPSASGTTFAPIQPDNATGNFTKIVQRLPVRIALKPHQPKATLLRLGMSVETTIHTDLADVVSAPPPHRNQTSMGAAHLDDDALPTTN